MARCMYLADIVASDSWLQKSGRSGSKSEIAQATRGRARYLPAATRD